jgi:hypothetical protein
LSYNNKGAKRSKKKKREGSPKRVSAMKEKNKGTTPQWDDAFY